VKAGHDGADRHHQKGDDDKRQQSQGQEIDGKGNDQKNRKDQSIDNAQNHRCDKRAPKIADMDTWKDVCGNANRKRTQQNRDNNMHGFLLRIHVCKKFQKLTKRLLLEFSIAIYNAHQHAHLHCKKPEHLLHRKKL